MFSPRTIPQVNEIYFLGSSEANKFAQLFLLSRRTFFCIPEAACRTTVDIALMSVALHVFEMCASACALQLQLFVFQELEMFGWPALSLILQLSECSEDLGIIARFFNSSTKCSSVYVSHTMTLAMMRKLYYRDVLRNLKSSTSLQVGQARECTPGNESDIHVVAVGCPHRIGWAAIIQHR